jgi:hypothetical protein
LPLTLPVTAQVQTAAGACWTATYSTAIVNSTARLKASSD